MISIIIKIKVITRKILENKQHTLELEFKESDIRIENPFIRSSHRIKESNVPYLYQNQHTSNCRRASKDKQANLYEHESFPTQPWKLMEGKMHFHNLSITQGTISP